MKEINLTQEQKVMLAIFLGIMLLLCIAGYIIFINLSRQKPTATPQLFIVPTSGNLAAASAQVYLPVIDAELPPVQVKPSSFSEALPTETPTASPSNVWKIISIDPLSYSLRGYLYDLGVFENVSTGENVHAFCANPGWPSPNLGDLFIRNAWDVLVPLNNDQPPFIQHFIVINQ